MAKIGRPGLSAEKKAELWERWKSGQCASDIARSLERTKGAIHHVLAFNGGIAPVARRRGPAVLVLDEREEISRGIAAGRSIRGIAARLGRSPSTVSREVAGMGGEAIPRHRGGRARLGVGAAAEAVSSGQPSQATMACCREAGARLVTGADLGMAEARIPCRRGLAGVPRNHLSQSVCPSPRRAQERVARASSGEAAHALSEGGTTPSRLPGQIVDAISIRERPPEIEDRAVSGHWEGDLLSGTNNSHMATLVERHSRFAMLIKVQGKDTASVASALSKQVRKLPLELRRSLTWDRGKEMADHKNFTIATDVQVYFCDPRSPWQRGSAAATKTPMACCASTSPKERISQATPRRT